MSSGSKIVPVRINATLLNAIEDAIAGANVQTFDQPYTVSEWIRKAVAEKLDHLARGRRKAPKKRKVVQE